MSSQRNVSFPQLLQINEHEVHRIRHHLSPAGQDRVEYGEEQQLGTGSASLGKNMEKVIVSELIVN